MSEDIRDQVTRVLEQVRPLFRDDGVEIELLGVRGGVVSLHVDTTGCTGCASPQEVLESGLERLLREKVPGITRIVTM
ncbi:MAG: NifU family protein [Candidatus Eisenbacteria bacterium]|nr:NifU family protein [Candidatus Eisenbacteria bacterium]